VRALVTLGEMLPDGEVQPTASVVVVRSAPHREILRQASLLITHCGHGRTMKALTAGVPIVCIPMGRDQNDTAARVVHVGAGVRLRPRSPRDGTVPGVPEKD
jgi:UDP:flavonoid glycosyltransferase YjiC (YdhE family)